MYYSIIIIISSSSSRSSSSNNNSSSSFSLDFNKLDCILGYLSSQAIYSPIQIAFDFTSCAFLRIIFVIYVSYVQLRGWALFFLWNSPHHGTCRHKRGNGRK